MQTVQIKYEAYVRKMDNIKDASMNFSQGVLFVELQDASRSEDTIKAIMTVIPTGGRCDC